MVIIKEVTMTFGRFKNTVAGLLTGDNILPADNGVILGLLGMAFSEVSTHANALHLATMNKGDVINRVTSDPMYFYRSPELPEIDEDVLDIDEELGYPTARFVAGYVSDKKALLHKNEGMRLIREYNSKVAEMVSIIAPGDSNGI